MTKSTSKLFQNEAPEEMKEDALNLPADELKEEVITETDTEVIDTPACSDEDVQIIDLSAIKKKRFAINGDKDKIIELNTSDLGISNRLSIAYDKLTKYMDEVGEALKNVPDEGEALSEEQEKVIEEQLSNIDAKMREEVDYIFDAPISDLCCDGGSMYDPFEGQFRFEHIIDALTKLYENNLNNEFNKMKRRVAQKTSKYTKKYHN